MGRLFFSGNGWKPTSLREFSGFHVAILVDVCGLPYVQEIDFSMIMFHHEFKVFIL